MLTSSTSNNVQQSSQSAEKLGDKIPEETKKSSEQDARMEFVTSSMRQRGNWNKALLLKERREWFKQRRTNAFKICDMVNSKEVANEWVQERSKVMVVIVSKHDKAGVCR